MGWFKVDLGLVATGHGVVSGGFRTCFGVALGADYGLVEGWAVLGLKSDC